MANYAQLTLIKDDERKTRNVMKEHFLTLRETVIKDRDFDSMSKKDALGVLLAIAGNSKADPVTTAEKLLETFGSLKGVMEARPEQLANVDGLSKKGAEMIALITPLVKLWHRECAPEPDRIGNSREAESFCLSLLAGRRTEAFYVVSLNCKCNVLGARKISEGSLSEVSAYPRMVMEAALNYNAHSVLLSHNHPGGTCAPSPEDISSTIQLQRLLNGVGILVLDHIIVAGDQTYSMIQHGDIDYRTKSR